MRCGYCKIVGHTKRACATLNAVLKGVSAPVTILPKIDSMPRSIPVLKKSPMSLLRTHHTYEETIQAIKTACASINCTYSNEGDGRITSAVKEAEYLDALTTALTEYDPSFQFVRPKERYWYDIAINGIPINLKITSGGTDNAFNKVAILYTMTGEEVAKRNMNYNQWFQLVRNATQKEVRDKQTEYHYLVVEKQTGHIILKSILDIHTYKSNPCNDLQINWANEFKHADYAIQDSAFQEKIKYLLRTVQNSVRQAVAGMREFAEADV